MKRGEAFRAPKLDAAYLDFRGDPRADLRRQFWSNHRGDPARAEQIELYWGKASKSERKGRSMATLGVIGRYFWPVQVCLESLSGQPVKATAIAEQMLLALRGNAAFESAIPQAQRRDRILNLLRRQARTYPPAGCAGILVDALLSAAHAINQGFEPEMVRDVLGDKKLRSPSAACEALAAALPEPEAPNDLQSLIHCVPCQGAPMSWVQIPPGNSRSSRKLPERIRRRRMV